ncbi:glycoprotein 3-alpha-L-fucosyltransferase A-like [Sitodiplosis mosellana]|uniref:glycoprotein 3-alpha-L-fucosyltransferase A-like n=1 Tax=Sitodiplosis mosellana TaxID=263140 RepID=UPI002444453E|nr:glycoprotein 3-alpha-L-fucosyltransferase A-like [Sitodiplosis mosellana]
MFTVKTWSLSSLRQKKFLVLFISVSLASLIIFLNLEKSSTTSSDALLSRLKRTVPIKVRPRPYYMSNGKVFPRPAKFSKKLGRRDAKILPEEDPDSDRFENQLMFIPPNYYETRNPNKNKTVLLYNGWGGFEKIMVHWFSNRKCPVDTCTFSLNRSDAETADFIMFSGQIDGINIKRTPNQIYAFYRLESPIHWPQKYPKSIVYNWTITYRHDSTISIPYSKWMYYDPRITHQPQIRNFAKNKTKLVAWMVSNCEAHNDRDAYVRELQKYIQVDVYGACGTMNCTDCHDRLERDYKFYLSFENSHCADYISEKVYRNTLGRSIIPVVLGARKEDYERQLPYNSFIYVEDFATPKDLAEYLHKVDKDDVLYNSYFQWRGTGEIHATFEYIWCRICALLHDEYTMNNPRWYDDINKWWFDPDTLRRGFWRNTKS